MSQQWVEIGGTTTIYGQPELSKEARMFARKQNVLEDAVVPATEFNLGKKSGDQVGLRIVGRLTTLATTALTEQTPIPIYKPPLYHVTGRAYRYGAGVSWTGTFEDLDRLDAESMYVQVLRDHFTRTRGSQINSTLVAGRDLCYQATGTESSPARTLTTNGTPSGTAARRFLLWDVRKLCLAARQYDIPAFDGSNFVFFGSPIIEDNIFNDTASNGYIDIVKYSPSGVEGALNGEAGKIGRVRFAIDNDSITDGIGTGSAFGSGFFMGADVCHEIMVYPIHFRANMNYNSDFGNAKALAWQGLYGFKVPRNYGSHGTGNASRMIHYTTA